MPAPQQGTSRTRSASERLVALVSRNRAGAARLVVVPGADHGLSARGGDGRSLLPDVVVQSVLEFLSAVGGNQ